MSRLFRFTGEKELLLQAKNRNALLIVHRHVLPLLVKYRLDGIVCVTKNNQRYVFSFPKLNLLVRIDNQKTGHEENVEH